MKRIIALLSYIVLFGSMSLQAAPVSQSRALEVAKAVLDAQQPATKATGDVKFIWNGEDIATKAAVQPAFYVFGRDGGGFVIIAGDDNVKPVLAVSDHNEFKVEGMPENVKWWMERMKAYVRSNAAPVPGASDEWAKYVATKSGRVAPVTVLSDPKILTPTWGQGSIIYYGLDDQESRQVFNSKCPRDANNNYTLTGCVATAVSEVMTTLSGLYPAAMPARPLVDHVEPYTATSAGRISATEDGNPYVFSDKGYDWTDLRSLMNMGDIRLAVQNGQFAILDSLDKLLADIGAMMHANYSANGTGANTSATPDTMIRYFGINKAARFEYAASYTRYQWEAKLKAELDKHPIIYRGEAKEGGHAFVFDGYGTYQEEYVFHVNFGWTGSCNGYYYEYYLATQDDPDFYNFSTGCGAVFDFYPDPTSPAPEPTPGNLSFYYSPGLSYTYSDDDGNTWKEVLSIGDGGTQLSIRGWLVNTGDLPFSGQLVLVLLDKDNNLKQDNLATETISSLESGYGYPSVCFDIAQITVPLAFGDKVVAFYTPGSPRKRLEQEFLDCDYVSELPVYPAAFIKTKNSYAVGDVFEFKLMNSDYHYAGTVWTITKPDGSSVNMAQNIGAFQLKDVGTYKIQAAVAIEVGPAYPVIETLVTNIVVH